MNLNTRILKVNLGSYRPNISSTLHALILIAWFSFLIFVLSTSNFWVLIYLLIFYPELLQKPNIGQNHSHPLEKIGHQVYLKCIFCQGMINLIGVTFIRSSQSVFRNFASWKRILDWKIFWNGKVYCSNSHYHYKFDVTLLPVVVLKNLLSLSLRWDLLT